jgi:hypothetical protein
VSDLRLLCAHHADLLTHAERCAESAARLDRTGDPERAEIARDDAEHYRAVAAAMAPLLAAHGVSVPDPRQLSLLSLGETTR